MKNLFVYSIVLAFFLTGCSTELGNSDLDTTVQSRSVCDGGAEPSEAWVVANSSYCNGTSCCFEVESTYPGESIQLLYTVDEDPSPVHGEQNGTTSTTSPYRTTFCISEAFEGYGISLHTRHGCDEYSFPCNPSCS